MWINVFLCVSACVCVMMDSPHHWTPPLGPFMNKGMDGRKEGVGGWYERERRVGSGEFYTLHPIMDVNFIKYCKSWKSQLCLKSNMHLVTFTWFDLRFKYRQNTNISANEPFTHDEICVFKLRHTIKAIHKYCTYIY